MDNLRRCAHCSGYGETKFECCYYKVFGKKPEWRTKVKCCACDGSGYKRVGGPIFPKVG